MDGRSNHRNKTAFSNFSGVEWMLHKVCIYRKLVTASYLTPDSFCLFVCLFDL